MDGRGSVPRIEKVDTPRVGNVIGKKKKGVLERIILRKMTEFGRKEESRWERLGIIE